MFAAQRQSLLPLLKWKPEHRGGLYFIETSDEQSGRLRHGVLEDDEVHNWVLANSCLPESPPPKSMLGGFRLLLCERSSLRDEGLQWRELHMSRDSFTLVEEAFLLPSATVPAFFDMVGVYSRFTECDAATSKIKYLKILVQGRRKLGVADCVLSLCYCRDTGWTYGFLCGEGLMEAAEIMNTEPLMPVLLGLLNPCLHLKSDPILIPAMLLKIYTERIHLFLRKQIVRLDELEEEIGVSRPGRVTKARSLENWPSDIDIKKVTIGLHSIATELYYLNRTCLWTHECLEFLHTLAVECLDYTNRCPTRHVEMRQGIEYETTRMKWIAGTLDTSKERVETQLSVLYSATSQRENAIALNYSRMAQEQNEISLRDVQMNTRIATSTKQDSIAMTTFTFIAALFLPGTYVASLFSMSMFDWLPSDGNGSGGAPRVSANFYIYWCITVPLTLLVMAGWYVWYRRADQAWQKDTGYSLNDNTGANRTVEVGVKSDG
ncbi:uncharacterized protein Z520_05207 [Fonsecaea multimorphosa CBS 102226]|uniref:Uncharacterized protein n=1 Tax=Fonsecaea multimorphosa CBS 102226 TaxID=1442371 RepID=A0A0D2IP07_9EURO|nr:uncharacterized protein Z520_05207 [Fonsecaea multimorphosa CBS 102226]KIX98746.1 hypothetical protein Z520_05207 [Fonsecaea multimorphosa CBS 102226]OAL25029.1 hypothetical protein AYO22_04906 [Fonsecaea multimorphosa]